jgi:septum formation protein
MEQQQEQDPLPPLPLQPLPETSPQRAVLLSELGVTFTVIPSEVDELSYSEADPAKRAVMLARIKAQDVASRNPGTWIIGCDTLVCAHDGSLLEKR